jgi:hypothetical protein
MRKINLTKSIGIGLLIAVMTTSLSCSKGETPKPITNEATAQIKDYDKLLNFFTWSIQVPKENIKFDSSTMEFYIPNTVVREKLERVQAEYDKANVYKLNFENK